MTISQAILNEAIQRLIEGFHPVKVILFGSQARGAAVERSDIDLIVLCEGFADRWQLAMEMNRLLWGLKLPCDILVFTPQEYEQEQQYSGTVARYAAREGKVLYDRAA